MIDINVLQHHIQKHIIGVLMYQKYARFSDMRPEGTETNLYSYHLKLLIKNGFVEKTDKGYTLSKKGVLFVDRVSTSTLDVRSQPKIITMLLVQNSKGEILLFRRQRQPFTNTWTLPYGKLHIDDRTLLDAAHREAKEKLDLEDQMISHVGDCYIRILSGDEAVMTTLAHIFRFQCDEVPQKGYLAWAAIEDLDKLPLAPAVKKIVDNSLSGTPYFFEEFEEDWYD